VAVRRAAFLYRKESINMDINGLIEPFQQFADHLQGASIDGPQGGAPQGEAPTEAPQGEAPADEFT